MTTYTGTESLPAGGIVVVGPTDDVTDSVVTVTIEADTKLRVQAQFKKSGDVNFTDLGDLYTINATTDQRPFTVRAGAGGVFRVTLSNDSSGVSAITWTISTDAIQSGCVSPEDVWRTAGISASVISRADVLSHILRAESEVEHLTGKPCGSETVIEEQWGNNKRYLQLFKTPVISITSLAIDDVDVTTTTIDLIKNTGRIILTDDSESSKFTLPETTTPNRRERNIDITYVWGYSTVPYWMRRMVECISAINILTQQTGGTYNDITSYTLGDFTASVGEPWTNINRTVQNLREEFNRLYGVNGQAVAVF